MKILALLLCVILFAGCSSPSPVEPVAVKPTPAPAPAPEAAPGKDPVDTTVKTELPRGKPGSLLAKIDRARLSAQVQQAPKAINIKQRCSFRNETGYNGSTLVEIANNEVKALSTQISVPLHGGSCSFEGSGFRQVARTPSIELRHNDGCTVRIWTQGKQLTISYSKCAARCSNPEVFKYIWPVLIDQPSGKCD